MHTYRIVQKIKTTAYLYQPQRIRTFEIENFDPKLPQLNAWAATEIATGSDLLTVSNASRKRLLRILTALSFVLQCEFSLQGMSFLTWRLDANPENICYMRHIRLARAIGMPFWTEDQISDVERLLSADDGVDPLNLLPGRDSRIDK